MKNSFKYHLLTIFMLSSYLLAGQTIIPQKLDSTLSTLSKNYEPGFAVAITQYGKVKYIRSFGMSDLLSGKKNAINTPFDIASMSKQFTAACIYLLESEAKLNTTDKLSKYFPGLPSYADSITIAHLIHHQSGLRDYKTLLWLRNMEDNSAYGNTEVYQILSKQQSLNFAPGTQYSYSNTGYYFLSEIIKKVSGKDLLDFSKEHLFKPLNMHHTTFSRSHNVKGKANGYVMDGKAFQISNPRDSTIGQGNAYSTVSDWQKWFQEMSSHKLLGNALWDKMLSPALNSDGTPTLYAGGLWVLNYHDKASIIHGGDIPGYHSKMAYFPKEHLGIVIFANNDNILGNDVLENIYNNLFTAKKNVSTPAANLAQTNTASLPILNLDSNRYTGIYRLNDNKQLIFEIKIAGNKLMATQIWDETTYPIEAVNDSLFYIEGDHSISFEFDKAIDGKATKMGITQDKQIHFANRDNDALSGTAGENKEEYTGSFYNPEIDASYNVSIVNKQLMLTIGATVFKILPTETVESYAILGNGMHMTFKRDEDHRICGFDLNHTRVKNLYFTKK